MSSIKNYSFITLFILTLFGNKLNSQIYVDNSPLPYQSYLYQEIEENVDQGLQYALEQLVTNNPYWNKLISENRMSVGLVDLRNKYDIKYASINGDEMMYAASLPKIAVLLTAMEAIKNKEIPYNASLKNDLRLMIAKSNNAATTRVIERLGFQRIAKVMTSDKYNLYDIDNGGGLWVGKKYAKAGKRNPDPLKGLSHAATVDQVCRYYTMLAYGKLVSPEYNKEMMGYLVNPELHHKFVNTLDQIAPDVDIYRKSGSWRNYHSDSVLVYGEDGRKYILVALIDDPAGGKICKDLVHVAESALGIDDIEPSTPIAGKVQSPTASPKF